MKINSETKTKLLDFFNKLLASENQLRYSLIQIQTVYIKCFDIKENEIDWNDEYIDCSLQCIVEILNLQEVENFNTFYNKMKYWASLPDELDAIFWHLKAIRERFAYHDDVDIKRVKIYLYARFNRELIKALGVIKEWDIVHEII